MDYEILPHFEREITGGKIVYQLGFLRINTKLGFACYTVHFYTAKKIRLSKIRKEKIKELARRNNYRSLGPWASC